MDRNDGEEAGRKVVRRIERKEGDTASPSFSILFLITFSVYFSPPSSSSSSLLPPPHYF
jgi:hypothetical protein